MTRSQRILALGTVFAFGRAHGFLLPSSRLSTGSRHRGVSCLSQSSENDIDTAWPDIERPVSRENVNIEALAKGQKGRRQVFADVLRLGSAAAAGCACLACSPGAAHGLAQITGPSADAIAAYDLPRDAELDAAFAQDMAYGMRDYEAEAYPKKRELFRRLFSSLEDKGTGAVVAEVGMGSFPNALYYARNKKVRGLDIIGVDPNNEMEYYAKDSAKRAKLLDDGQGDSLRIAHGVSEALPLADNSCDAVVCTLTLCSVVDPERSVAEIKRVLKPGGKFLFWEHVLSQTDDLFALQQVELTPAQVKRADGCHLDRSTGDTIKTAGFRHLEMEYLELTNFGLLNPTICGIATA
uniref:Methyltransferase type 11 domain-containing protein n=1 Tax=Odontella aurita TaxID=265563 RepID=A0A7S4MUI5_9STRA|mmetsp:Transcript_31841/g.95317  ORF Transcript_31841/g.95317 Transcript_31841/m.95317 type:complete len:352 (+) Transcript_31841:132-1187(+)